MPSQRSFLAQRASRLTGNGSASGATPPARRRVLAAGLAAAAVSLAALVTAMFLIPDFLLVGTPGNPTGPMTILMLMRLATTTAAHRASVPR
jgi:uncharacterized RDD family membrane protein YckC